MLLGGLWHGAGWTFIVWGGYHGLLLSLYRRFSLSWDRLPQGFRHIATLLLVLVGWVFFRATDFGMAASLLTKMILPTSGSLGTDPGLAIALILIAGTWAVLGPNAFDLFTGFTWKRRYGYAMAAGMGGCVAILAAGGNSPFLYFQF